MPSVYSSFVTDIDYDPVDEALYVSYRNGQKGVYLGVPPEIGIKALPQNAPSIGQALHAHIRGRFEFKYLKKDKE